LPLLGGDAFYFAVCFFDSVTKINLYSLIHVSILLLSEKINLYFHIACVTCFAVFFASDSVWHSCKYTSALRDVILTIEKGNPSQYTTAGQDSTSVSIYFCSQRCYINYRKGKPLPTHHSRPELKLNKESEIIELLIALKHIGWLMELPENNRTSLL
jgi:hypothetical protein